MHARIVLTGRSSMHVHGTVHAGDVHTASPATPCTASSSSSPSTETAGPWLSTYEPRSWDPVVLHRDPRG
ncbi:hypothetical protein ACO03V_02640 [Microbacterium sp. HMH0099]|uniref:hypothetical protein n=1 Tax=Microbacterium sp. HMH0099 TaxID=3414026 RepID=UPI003BF729A5